MSARAALTVSGGLPYGRLDLGTKAPPAISVNHGAVLRYGVHSAGNTWECSALWSSGDWRGAAVFFRSVRAGRLLNCSPIMVGAVVVALRINDRRTRDDTHHHSPKQANP